MLSRALSKTPKTGIAAVTAAAAVASLLGLGGCTRANAGTVPAAMARIDPADRQAIKWHGCRTGTTDELGAALDAAGAQCGEVTVPLDYRRPSGRTITVAISRVRSTDAARRRGVLLLNPGGPGVPGLEEVLLGAYQPEIAKSYDLIGMDPRFVGRSTPLSCRWSTDTFLRSAGPDRRGFTQSVRLAKELAAGCAERDRDLLPYASTRNTARDMDTIRAALGESRISYLGASYGTYLGAVYLQMFGARADRFVLDGAVDPDVYGPGLLSRDAPAAATALERWAAWTAGQGSRYGLGTTTGAVLGTVNRINEAAAAGTLRIGRYAVDAHVLPYLLFVRLYDDSEEAYATLATDVRTLDQAATGSPAEPGPLLTEFLTNLFTGTGAATDRAGTPILCADRAVSHDPETYFRDIEVHRATEPLFGPLTRNITPCAFWPTAPVEAPTTIRNGVPALIVGSDGDPAAPYPGQQAMHRALSGSPMVTLLGSYRHTVYLTAGNACVDGAVNRYLLGGALPGADGTCARN